ncbi:murein hydrolase activator EnvC family protein [Helicobacter marmotae]|uniref:Metallopeptidase n=1 Tax=Helicobacter marmotae TaxID=152490 RepID=A0A3D8I746_9HELI|nr:peptidoglycan DD-metalloendopeptidase family protein [Helicobacter marmotae]RDU61000.1 metallopeptidase [Helicobacter marmotae]
MKAFGWIAVCMIVSLCMANIEQDIAKNKDKLATAQSQEKAISKKLDELGKAINAKNLELTQLGKQIEILQKDIAYNQTKSISQEKTLKDSQRKQESLIKQKHNVEDQIVKLFAQSLAFSMMINRYADIDSPEGVVEYYVYETLYHNTQKLIKTLNAKQSILDNEVKKITNTISQIQSSIKTQTDKKEYLERAKEQQKNTLAKMQTELKTYNEQLKDIVKERKSLDDILSKLNIVKEQKEQSNTQQAFINNQKSPDSIKAPKQLGTSYRDVPTIAYRGAKTFPPLEQYTIEKKFGPYFDPVYKFKIFNAAIMFNPKTLNANVKNVLDGRVVYAKEAPGLKKVVIIEHINAIHTIYAYMDKIESSIKTGINIKKGTIIGKVNERLSFEITQKDKHINPADFIKLH